MRVIRAFSRAADTYGQYNLIQRDVARHLVMDYLPNNPGHILDLGCGTGELCRQLLQSNVDFKTFIGVDLSSSMLCRHPQDEKIFILQGDFNDVEFLRQLGTRDIQTVLSSSALQWTKDLDRTLRQLSAIGEEAAFAIFTSGTFRSLHSYLGLDSPIRDFDTVQGVLERYYTVYRIERREYRLDFENRKELFHYIKGSGVSGGTSRLSVAQARRLVREYPSQSLEFEVLFFRGRPRSSFSRA
ncbi:methyltransferase [Nitratifractor salsuginis]|uniref:Methyltransferase type 12 n=1 Tax=Nitratifractor salsuginis (strain DSM 16511 / JCM 12458 / E9I37-1) TaxID=749222 RepID=E6X3D4_NITSE|nr:methyltransferase [Nitratifractor salsuginis]ADV47347.1 Methyltransferase type 12 [Nitratifractor salsuginis DSM 16511]